MTFVDSIVNGIFTGIGAGFGSAVGMWFYKKYMEARLDGAHERIKNVSGKVLNVDEKANEIIHDILYKDKEKNEE